MVDAARKAFPGKISLFRVFITPRDDDFDEDIRAINRTIESEISNITDVIYVNRGVGSRPARPPRPGRMPTSLTGLYKPVRFFKERKSITSYINLPIYITNLNNILFHKIDVV